MNSIALRALILGTMLATTGVVSAQDPGEEPDTEPDATSPPQPVLDPVDEAVTESDEAVTPMEETVTLEAEPNLIVVDDETAAPSVIQRLDNIIDLHGFVSEGFLVSTANDYLGHSSRGSFEFFEAALNVSAAIRDGLRAGIQIFARDIGPLGNFVPTLDWAYLDYRPINAFGLRAGRFKTPWGLYNTIADVDAGRPFVLLPQSTYPTESRSFLIATNGFGIYGQLSLGPLGTLDYDAYVGTGLLEETPGQSDFTTDTRILAGGRLMLHPVEGLQLGGSALYTNVQISGPLSEEVEMRLEMEGGLPDDYDGTITADLEKIRLWVVSLEYTRGDWTVAAEYSRWRYEIDSNIPALTPAPEIQQERFYGALSYRVTDWLQLAAYFSARFEDVDDHDNDATRALDTALTFRFDINDHWLVKFESHYTRGTAALNDTANPSPEIDWGLFILRTTVVF